MKKDWTEVMYELLPKDTAMSHLPDALVELGDLTPEQAEAMKKAMKNFTWVYVDENQTDG